MRFVRPLPLTPGATVRIVAPSSPFDRARFDAGLALLSARYRVVQGAALFEQHGFVAGPDALRLRDLEEALADPDASAIVAPRGGYGATRLLPSLMVENVRAACKTLVGFSDITALHALWARAGLCSIHGPMVCSLADASSAVRDAWFALLEGGAPEALHGLRTVVGGQARGRLFGGNLTVLTALVGTPYMPLLEDVVLALEDVGERPYRLDRMLTTLLQSGVLAGVRAVVLGQFTDCAPGADGTTAREVLEERLGTLGVPVLADAPFGHVTENWPLLFGAEATVDGEAGCVRFAVQARDR